MKNKIKILCVLLLMFAGFNSCIKDDPQPYSGVTFSTPAVWKLTSFELNGVEYTEYYENYRFYFKSKGAIMVTGGSETVHGTWISRCESGQYYVLLNFGNKDPLFLLNHDNWKVMHQAARSIDLKGKRGDDGLMFLSFRKVRNL